MSNGHTKLREIRNELNAYNMKTQDADFVIKQMMKLIDVLESEFMVIDRVQNENSPDFKGY